MNLNSSKRHSYDLLFFSTINMSKDLKVPSGT
jgi:hypothetical protein